MEDTRSRAGPEHRSRRRPEARRGHQLDGPAAQAIGVKPAWRGCFQPRTGSGPAPRRATGAPRGPGWAGRGGRPGRQGCHLDAASAPGGSRRHATCSDFPFRGSLAACGEQRGPGGDPQMRLSQWPRGQGQPDRTSTRRLREATPVSVTLGFRTVLTRQEAPLLCRLAQKTCARKRSPRPPRPS